MVAMDDQTDRHRHDIGVAADIFRQRYLVAVFDLSSQDRRLVGDSSGRAIHRVDPLGLEDFGEPGALRRPQPALSSTDCRPNSGLRSGQWARTASAISIMKRIRFAS